MSLRTARWSPKLIASSRWDFKAGSTWKSETVTPGAEWRSGSPVNPASLHPALRANSISPRLIDSAAAKSVPPQGRKVAANTRRSSFRWDGHCSYPSPRLPSFFPQKCIIHTGVCVGCRATRAALPRRSGRLYRFPNVLSRYRCFCGAPGDRLGLLRRAHGDAVRLMALPRVSCQRRPCFLCAQASSCALASPTMFRSERSRARPNASYTSRSPPSSRAKANSCLQATIAVTAFGLSSDARTIGKPRGSPSRASAPAACRGAGDASGGSSSSPASRYSTTSTLIRANAKAA